MTTPNEELRKQLQQIYKSGELYYRVISDTTDLPQSQAERIKELELDLDIQAGSIEAVQAANSRLAAERDTLRAELADAELHTKQVERGLDKATAQLAEIEKTEPVAKLKPCREGWFIDLDNPPPLTGETIELFTRHMPEQDVEASITTLQEAPYRSLYELTGDIKDFNTILVPRTALAQQELPQKERPDFMAGYDAGMADAKRMAQQGEPVAYITETEQGPMVWTPEMYGEACTYCDDGEFPVPLYTVTALRSQVEYLEKIVEDHAKALAQQGEQPVCHGCGIPAGDVHMSTCKSGKWPSRVSNGDTAAPAPQAQHSQYGSEDLQALILAKLTAPQAQEPAKCNHCGGTGELEQFTSAGAPTTKMVCLFCKGDKSFPVFKDKNPELAWIEQCKRDEEPAPQPASEPVANFIVSAVVIKDTSVGFNTQNKLYPVSAANSDEATGKALPLVTNDFPEHRLHTMCFIQTAPAPQAQEPARNVTKEEDAILRGALLRSGTVIHPKPTPQPAQGEPTGCACRWDADDNRVATCARHQGWLDVVHEWAERAKAAEVAVQSAQPAQEPVKFLVNGTRFKLSFDTRGRVSSLWNFMDELDGRWVALVAAEDDCHLQSAQPVAQPLTDKRISWLWSESHNDTTDRMAFQVFARAIEAAHGITGHVPKTNFGDIKQPRELTDEHIAAANMCRKAGRVSVSMVQRKMNTGYQEAQVLVAEIVAAGLVDGIEASGLPNI